MTLDELKDQYGDQLEETFGPGSFGCHELLDRLSQAQANFEAYIKEHPSCIMNPEWHELAEKAGKLLIELYEKVGIVHMGNPEPEKSVGY